jgi:hypothetical protein
MEYITTTEFRTKTPDLVAALLAGYSVDLIHRSKVIGELVPKNSRVVKVIDPEKFASALKGLEPDKKASYKQLMKNYQRYMSNRHGSNIS